MGILRYAKWWEGCGLEKQIPFGDDNKKGKSENNCEKQIPFGNDNKRGKSENKNSWEKQIPSGNDNKKNGNKKGNGLRRRVAASSVNRGGSPAVFQAMRASLGICTAVLGFLSGAVAAPLSAQESRQLLETPVLESSVRLELRLHAGGYHVEASNDGKLHVMETRDAAGSARRATDVRFHQTRRGAEVEVDPPLNNHGETWITIALPPCAALDLELTAGELVFDAVPCEATDVSMHAGEVRASLGDGESYRKVRGSVTIGEVDARALGTSRPDESHGGFFRSFERSGKGTRTFAAHVGSGQVTLEGKQE